MMEERKMKILVVLPRFPYPLEKGDKLRAYHQIVQLSKRHEVALFCVSHTAVGEEEMEHLRPYCKHIRVHRLNKVRCVLNVARNWFRSRSLQQGYWSTEAAKREYARFEEEVQPDVVYSQMVRTMPLVRDSKRTKVMDFQDALSMNAERRMEYARGLWHYVLHYEFKMLRSAEYDAFALFDRLTIISETDSEAIPHRKNNEICIVPNGVDMDFFRAGVAQPYGRRFDIVFCGNMSYAPNVNAARFLVEEVMPRVWKERPQTTLLLAGASPKAAVSRLGEEERVEVSGWLPDIRSAYEASTLFVAPMQIGSGLQNKLLEAMSIGLPCITTTIANSALGAKNGEEVCVADGVEAMSTAILQMLQNSAAAEAMAARGNAFVKEKYGWEAAVEKLETVLIKAVEEHGKRQLETR